MPLVLVRTAEEALDPDALTIGFAPRFTVYKRANLILRDPDRLARLLNDPDRPLQIVFAGKAHPADHPGQALMREIVHLAAEPRFRRRIVFLEDYDIEVARLLVQGADVWLNTPRRPLEASGTSGMKAVVSGGLHLSVLDGWWAEAYTPDNGLGDRQRRGVRRRRGAGSGRERGALRSARARRDSALLPARRPTACRAAGSSGSRPR